MKRKKRKARWILPSGLAAYKLKSAQMPRHSLHCSGDAHPICRENVVCQTMVSHQLLTCRHRVTSSFFCLLMCTAVVSAAGQGRQYTLRPHEDATRTSPSGPTGGTPSPYKDHEELGEGIRYTLVEEEPVPTPTTHVQTSSLLILPSSSIPVFVSDSLYTGLQYTDVTENWSVETPSLNNVEPSIESSAVIIQPTTTLSDLPTLPLQIVPMSSYDIASDLSDWLSDRDAEAEVTSASFHQTSSVIEEETESVIKTQPSAQTLTESFISEHPSTSIYLDISTSLSSSSQDAAIDTSHILPSSSIPSLVSASLSEVIEVGLSVSEEVTSPSIYSTSMAGDSTVITSQYASHLTTPHNADNALSTGPTEIYTNSTDSSSTLSDVMMTTHENTYEHQLDFAVKFLASSVVRCSDRPATLNTSNFVKQSLVKMLDLNESHVFVSGPTCDCMTVNILSLNRSQVKHVENLVKSRKISFLMNFTLNNEIETLRFMASSTARFDANNLRGGADECTHPHTPSKRALWRRLSSIERAIVIAVCTAGGLIIILAFLFCLYEVQRRHYQKSFRLRSPPSLTLQSEDFTLTKLERPNTMYNDRGLIMEPIHPEDVDLPALPATGSLERPRSHVVNGRHQEWPLSPDPFPIQASTSTENLVAAAAAARRRAGRERSPGYDNPSFSSDDILASDLDLASRDIEGQTSNHHVTNKQGQNNHNNSNGISYGSNKAREKIILNGHSAPPHSNGKALGAVEELIRTESNS